MRGIRSFVGVTGLLLGAVAVACARSGSDLDGGGGAGDRDGGQPSGGTTGAGGGSHGGGPQCTGSEPILAQGIARLTLQDSAAEIEPVATIELAPGWRVSGDDAGFIFVPARPNAFVQAAPDGTLSRLEFPNAEQVQDVARFFGVDLDADDDNDLVVMTISSAPSEAGHLSVWERNGLDLTHRVSTTLAGNSIERAPVAFGDLNNDGHTDIVTAEGEMPVVYVSDGAFGFERTEAGPMLEPSGTHVAAGLELIDLDGDNDLDLLELHMTCCDNADPFVAFRPGDAAGGFGPATISELGTAIDHFSGFADVTGDGVPDLVYVAENEPGELALMISRGDAEGSFEAGRRVRDALQAYFPVVVDMTGDGIADVVSSVGPALPDRPHASIQIFDIASAGEGQVEPEVFQLAEGQVLSIAAGRPGEAMPTLANFGCRAPCNAACTGSCIFDGCIP